MKTKLNACFLLLFFLVFLSCRETGKTPVEIKEFKVTGHSLPDTFLLGSHLCRVPQPPMKEMLADMDNLKAHGFILIKIQTHWAIDEPLEGKYEFERYDTIVQHAKDLGMYVYMGFTLEQAPAWLYTKYPDCRMVGRNGLPIKYETQYTTPADGKPGPCFDHPDAMKKQVEYIKTFVNHFAKYDNILVWNTWQEIGYSAEFIIGTDVCYCDNTQEHFRMWLKKKYGSLEQLNKSWGSNFGNWEQVVPHRQRSIGMAVDKDFRYFMGNEYVAQTLIARYRAIKEADPKKRTVFAHKTSVSIGSGQEWTYARYLDFMGASCYPAGSWVSAFSWDDHHQSREYPPQKYPSLYNEMWGALALRYDYVRCSNPDNNPIWAAEFQGGPVISVLQKGRVPSASDIRRWMLTAVSSGVTAISFWVTRAEIVAQENNGFSLLDSEGDSNERFEEASRIGRILKKHSDVFAKPTKPKSAVGIVINEDNYSFCKSFFGTDRHLEYSVRGWYQMLWRSGYPVDFVNIDSLRGETALQYKALILPFPLQLSEKYALKLKEYVTAGGNLICEGAAGRINENCLSERGEISPVIAEMAGVKQKSFVEVSEPDGGRRWTPMEGTWGEFAPATWLKGEGSLNGKKMLANFYLQTFNLKGGTPVFTAGTDVAGVVNNVGKGKIWLFGTLFGHGGTAYFQGSNLDFVNTLMTQAGISPQRIGDLLYQRRINGNKEAWIITNPTEKDIKASFDINKMKNPEIIIGNKLETKKDQGIIDLNSLDIAVLLFEN
jgi:beta-galactosidase